MATPRTIGLPQPRSPCPSMGPSGQRTTSPFSPSFRVCPRERSEHELQSARRANCISKRGACVFDSLDMQPTGGGGGPFQEEFDLEVPSHSCYASGREALFFNSITMGQNPVPLANIKMGGKWMFIHPKSSHRLCPLEIYIYIYELFLLFITFWLVSEQSLAHDFHVLSTQTVPGAQPAASTSCAKIAADEIHFAT